MKKTTVIGTLSAAFLATVTLIGCNNAKTEYSVGFLQGGHVVSEMKISSSNMTIKAPKAEPTEHYDQPYWYCEADKIEIGSEGEYTFTELKNYKFEWTAKPTTYTVTFKKDGAEDVKEEFNVNNPSVVAPEFDPPAQHYTARWSASGKYVGEKTADSGQKIDFTKDELHDWEFTYVEDATPYLITFVKGEQTVETITKKITDPDLKFTAPTFTPTTHYDGEWYCAELGTGVSLGSGEECDDLTPSNLDNYTFIYDEEAHEYEVEFYSLNEGELLDTKTISVDDSTFTAPTVTPTTHYDGSFVCKSHTGISSIGSGEEVTIPTESLDDYKFVWEETEHEYPVIFYDLDGEEVEEATVSLSSKTITAPEITDEPEEGYHYAWVSEDPALVLASEGSTTLDDDDLADYYFYETAVGNEYTVTYDANGGTLSGTGTTDTFTYGEEYSLRTATYDLDDATLVGWNNTATKKNIPSTGTWDIADDVTLKAQYGISFDGYEVGATTVDSFKDPNNCSIAVAEDGGEKVLKVTPSAYDYGVKVKKTYLDMMFADSNVTGVSFMAKADVAQSNFRYSYGGTTNVCYERNQNGWGLNTYWKTFTLTRTAYSTFTDNDYMIWGGGSAGNPTWIEIKNIKPTTDSLKEFETTARGTSFEGGWLRSLSDNNPLYYNAGVSSGGDVNLLKALEFGALSSHTAFISDELATDGNLSLGFTRAAGSTDWMSLCVFNIGNAQFDYTVSFDFYSDIRLNSYGTTQNISDGKDQAFGTGDWHVEPNTWTHFDLTTDQMSTPSAAGRTVFMKVKGSATFSQFNFYIDNIVFTPIA